MGTVGVTVAVALSAKDRKKKGEEMLDKTYYDHECPCGYSWRSKLEKPKSCPMCKRYFKIGQEPKPKKGKKDGQQKAKPGVATG